MKKLSLDPPTAQSKFGEHAGLELVTQSISKGICRLENASAPYMGMNVKYIAYNLTINTSSAAEAIAQLEYGII